MRRGGGSNVTRGVLSLLGVVVVLLGVAQLVLPRIAASRISSRIGRYGKVTSVHVSAWPAVELLWKHADSVTVHVRDLAVNPAQTDKLLAEARGVDRLDAYVQSAREGPLSVSDVHLSKRAHTLRARAFASVSDVRAALPPGFAVQLLGSSNGRVEVRASGGPFGIGASVDAVAEARDGKLVVYPRGPLIEALKLTLFDEPDVHLDSVGARASTGAGGEPGYALEASATVR
jgi:hypothetical protein